MMKKVYAFIGVLMLTLGGQAKAALIDSPELQFIGLPYEIGLGDGLFMSVGVNYRDPNDSIVESTWTIDDFDFGPYAGPGSPQLSLTWAELTSAISTAGVYDVNLNVTFFDPFSGDQYYAAESTTLTVVSEPSIFGLLGLGIVAIGWNRRKRKRQIR